MVTLKITRKPARHWVTISIDPGQTFGTVIATWSCPTYKSLDGRVEIRNLGCKVHSP